MRKILIIEDDIYLREELITTFTKEGYPASGISSFAAPEQEILDAQPDLVVLDINLPGKSGFELCRWLKGRTAFPILILTARDDLSDELYALGLGADDYMTKPFHPDRLLARVRRLLQMYGKLRSLIQAGGLSLDLDTYKVLYGEASVTLPETEGKILRTLMERCPAVVSKTELFGALWGGEDFVDENILQVNMSRLRKSLEDAGISGIIQNVRGQGYRLEVGEK